MKFSSTIKWLVIGLVLLTISVIVVTVMTMWLQQQGAELKAAMQTIANEEALLHDQARLNSVLSETTEDRQELQTYVLKGDDGAVALLSEIDRLASQLGIELTTTSLDVAEVEGDFNDLMLTFTISGFEHRIRQALLVFETLPYAADITDLQLNRSYDPATGTNQMNGRVSLRVSII